MHAALSLPTDALVSYCRRNGIRRLDLFGSATREDFGPDSDVDLLVDFGPDAKVGFLALSRMQRELAALIGRHVDLVPRRGLKPAIAASVMKAAEPLYAE